EEDRDAGAQRIGGDSGREDFPWAVREGDGKLARESDGGAGAGLAHAAGSVAKIYHGTKLSVFTSRSTRNSRDLPLPLPLPWAKSLQLLAFFFRLFVCGFRRKECYHYRRAKFRTSIRMAGIEPTADFVKAPPPPVQPRG